MTEQPGDECESSSYTSISISFHKEVNCTELSPSDRVPCKKFGRHVNFQLKGTHRHLMLRSLSEKYSMDYRDEQL
jgi:hypothetical protein